MARPTISLVIPTIGRPLLARALASVRQDSWLPGDEVLLIGDGPCPVARSLWDQYGLPGRYVETPERLGYWGHGARNWVIETRLARGSHLMALDDDDQFLYRPLAIIRTALEKNPDRPHLFRMKGEPCNGVVWRPGQMTIREGNVGTPMFVTPNDPARLGRYTPRYGGDCDFIRETCGFYPAGPVWHENEICLVRPIPR